VSQPTAALIDCLGLACPIPVVRLAKAIGQADIGGEVIVLSDDPGAKVDIPVWCRLKDQELVAREDRAEGGWSFRVRRLR
jgi:TusA-related sulfurtransferase